MNCTINIVFFIIFVFIFYIINNILKIKINISNERFSNDTIPKIIIQTWKTKVIPPKYKNDVKSVKKYNSDYKFLFFSDDEIDYFLKENYPKYFISYNKLPVKIQKIDFFRYIAVYHYGGFYFDLDITALYPLDELLNYDSIFPIDLHLTPKMCIKKRFKKYCHKNVKIFLGQYAFGAKPHNEFIKLLIDTIHNNIDKYVEQYSKNGKTLQYVYSTTGPDFVTDTYFNYKNKKSIHILEFEHSQYFGKYAKHNCYGTWK